jgi:hypothetical protein
LRLPEGEGLPRYVGGEFDALLLCEWLVDRSVGSDREVRMEMLDCIEVFHTQAFGEGRLDRQLKLADAGRGGIRHGASNGGGADTRLVAQWRTSGEPAPAPISTPAQSRPAT